MPADISGLFPNWCDRVAAEFDHILADCLGGEPSLDNCAHLCSPCHKIKTATDQKYRAKRNKHKIDREKRDKRRAKPKAKIRSRGFQKGAKQKIASRGWPKKPGAQNGS